MQYNTDLFYFFNIKINYFELFLSKLIFLLFLKIVLIMIEPNPASNKIKYTIGPTKGINFKAHITNETSINIKTFISFLLMLNLLAIILVKDILKTDMLMLNRRPYNTSNTNAKGTPIIEIIKIIDIIGISINANKPIPNDGNQCFDSVSFIDSIVLGASHKAIK